MRPSDPASDPDRAELERRLADGLRPDRPDPERLLVSAERAVALVALAEAHAVDGLLAAALTRHGLAPRLPGDARDALRALSLRRQRDCAALSDALCRALGALGRAGIPAVVLKGAALALTRYAEPAQRPMTDLDLLVPPDAVDDAVAALAAAGFRVPREETTAFWREAYFHLPLRGPGPQSVLVELHWTLAQPERHDVPTDALFRAARPLDAGGASALRLGDEDMLVHLALHHAYHTFEPRLVWIWDQALLLTDPPPARDVLARARAWRAEIPLRLALVQVERVFPGLAGEEYRALASGSARVRWLLRRFGSGSPMPLFRGWSRRRTQLVLGALMLDRPGQVARAVRVWASRSRRFGDRAGRRPEMNAPR